MYSYLIISFCWFSIGIISYFIVYNPPTTTNSQETHLEHKNIEKFLHKRHPNLCWQLQQTFKIYNTENAVRLETVIVSTVQNCSVCNRNPRLLHSQFLHHLHTHDRQRSLQSANVLDFCSFMSSRYNLFNDKEIYFVVCGFCAVVITIQFLTHSIILNAHKRIGEALLDISAITTGLTIPLEQVVLAGLLGKFIPRSTQAYAAGIRRSTNSCCIMGALVAPLISRFMLVHGIIVSCMVYLFVLYLIYNRKVFEDNMTVIAR